MKITPALFIIIIALILSLTGFVLSVVMPQSNISDLLMLAALYSAAASTIIASAITKKLAKSKQCIYFVTGALLMLLGFVLQIMGSDFLNEILKVSGGLISIVALGYYIYLNRVDFRNSKWIWFMPFILSGCLLKLMRWPGANIIMIGCLAVITVTAIVQLTKFKNYTKVQLLILVWEIVMCVCISVFYLHHIKMDVFIIGYIFTWLALVDILLQQESNILGNTLFENKK